MFSPKLLQRLSPLSGTPPSPASLPPGYVMPALASLQPQTPADPRVMSTHHLTVSTQRAGSPRAPRAQPSLCCEGTEVPD